MARGKRGRVVLIDAHSLIYRAFFALPPMSTSDGQVTNAVVDAPPFAGTAVGNCVSAKFRGAHIPPFLGPPVTLAKSFTIN